MLLRLQKPTWLWGLYFRSWQEVGRERDRQRERETARGAEWSRESPRQPEFALPQRLYVQNGSRPKMRKWPPSAPGLPRSLSALGVCICLPFQAGAKILKSDTSEGTAPWAQRQQHLGWLLRASLPEERQVERLLNSSLFRPGSDALQRNKCVTAVPRGRPGPLGTRRNSRTQGAVLTRLLLWRPAAWRWLSDGADGAGSPSWRWGLWPSTHLLCDSCWHHCRPLRSSFPDFINRRLCTLSAKEYSSCSVIHLKFGPRFFFFFLIFKSTFLKRSLRCWAIDSKTIMANRQNPKQKIPAIFVSLIVKHTVLLCLVPVYTDVKIIKLRCILNNSLVILIFFLMHENVIKTIVISKML